MSNDNKATIVTRPRGEVGVVLTHRENLFKHAPAPTTRQRSNVLMGKKPNVTKTEVPQPKPVQHSEQLASAKKMFEQIKSSILEMVGFDPKMPNGLSVIVNKAQQLHDSATGSEDMAKAIVAIKQGLTYQKAINGFLSTYKGFKDQSTVLSNLSKIEHRAVRSAAREYKRAEGEGVLKYVYAKNPSDIEAAQTHLSTTCPSLAKNTVETNRKIEKYYGEITKAESKVEPWRDYQWFDLSTPLKSLETVRNNFGLAETIETAKQSLEGLKKFYEDLKQSEKKAKDFISELGKYKDARRSFMNVIHEASLLRGANTDEVMLPLITNAQNTVNSADNEVRTAATAEAIRTARKSLDAGFLKRCKERAEFLKGEAGIELGSIPQYNDLYSQLRSVRSQVAQMPGTASDLKTIDDLLAQHRIVSSGAPTEGYADAVKALKGKPDLLLENAKKSSELYLSKTLPLAVREVLEELDKKLATLAAYVPAYRIEGLKIGIAHYANMDKRDLAIEELKSLSKQIDQDIETGKKEQQDCKTNQQKLEQIIQQLKQQNAPALLYEPFQSQLDTYIPKLLEAKDFKAANISLTNLVSKGNDAYKIFQEDFSEWSKSKLTLEGLRKECLAIAAWPVVAGRAFSLYQDIGTLISTTESTLEYAKGVQSVEKFKSAHQTLLELLKQQHVGDPSVLEGYDQLRKTARQELDEQRQKVQSKLIAVKDYLFKLGVASSHETSLHTELASVWKAWLKALDNPELTPGQNPTEYLKQWKELTSKALLEIEQKCDKLTVAKDEKFTGELVKEGKVRDADKGCDKLWAQIVRLLNELRADNVDIQDLERSIEGHPFNPRPEKYVQMLMNLYKPIKERYDKRLQEIREKSKKGLEDTKALRLEVNFMKTEFFEFPGYFENLDQNLSDVEAMLGSDDVSLIATAEKMLEQYRTAFQKATDKSEDVSSNSLKAVLTKWQQILKKLHEYGDSLTDDGIVKEYMRDTFDRLNEEMKDIMVRMSSAGNEESLLDPALAMLEVLKMEVKIDRAIQAAQVQEELYKKFKTKFESIQLPSVRKPTKWLQEDKITALKKHTSTRIVGTTDSYWNTINTKLDKAKELAKTEGKIHLAFKELEAVEKELDEMLKMSPDDARVELQKKDATAEQDQRMLRDMIRQWSVDFDHFISKVLKSTKEIIEKNPKADMSQLKNLEKAAGFTDKQLQQYLYVMSKLPHRSLSSNPAPDMTEALNAFARARKELENHRRTADRLANNAESTNFNYEKDLEQVRLDWRDRATRFSKALDEMAREIEKVWTEATTDVNDKEHFLDKDDKRIKELELSGQSLAKSLRYLGSRFDPGVFDKAFQTISDKEAAYEKKLAAREDALRKVRGLKTEMLNNQLTQAIRRAKDNPFRDVRAEMGLLLAGIKKVEISVLVAVE